jgi:hypothetical protein
MAVYSVMADRAQSLRTSYRDGSFIQITTKDGQISGEIVDITDLQNVRNAVAHHNGEAVFKEHHKQQAEVYLKEIMGVLEHQ